MYNTAEMFSFSPNPTRVKNAWSSSTCLLYAPTPLAASECAPPLPGPQGGGHTRLRLKGWGSPNSNDWRNA